jgi:putative chitinase
MATSEIVAELVKAMDKAAIRSPVLRNGIMAIVEHEGGFGALKPEMGYSRTGNQRIRSIFGQRVARLTERELSELKSNDRRFFNFVYNGSNSVGRQLGNIPDTDDGYNWRGRGPIQLTGRGNYDKYGRLAGYPEIMQDPSLLDRADIGATITIVYIQDRYKGDGFEHLLRVVGNNTKEMADRKTKTFELFMKQHRFDAAA